MPPMLGMLSSWALIAVLQLSHNHVLANVHHLIVSNDQRSGFVVEPFCFAEGGNLKITVQNWKVRE
jgi:hypothetical protein